MTPADGRSCTPGGSAQAEAYPYARRTLLVPSYNMYTVPQPIIRPQPSIDDPPWDPLERWRIHGAEGSPTSQPGRDSELDTQRAAVGVQGDGGGG